MRLVGQGQEHTFAEVEAKIRDFLDANPWLSRKLEVRWAGDGRLKCRGYYRPGRIVLFEEQATRAGRGYSWPGHRSDRTRIGVAAHELGHHVHYHRPDVDPNNAEMPRERPVSGYEPDYAERFAETFRLFLLNPDLLARARPRRYAYLVDLGLRPIETRGWQEILAAAPPRMLATLDGWAPGLRGGAQSELLV